MTRYRSNTAGLRIYSADRSRTYKFRAGEFEAESVEAEQDIENFAALHSSYGIEKVSDEEVEDQESESDDDDTPPQAVLTDEEAEGMSVPELQEVARQNNLKVGGNRSDLVARLTGKEE